MLIESLFTAAKIWKQPKCPSTEERGRCGIRIHDGMLLCREKEQNVAISSNMDELGRHYAKVK